MKVVLDERWNGLDRHVGKASALLLPSGRMCCLGYLAKECGFTDEEIFNQLVITVLDEYDKCVTGLDMDVSKEELYNVLPQDLIYLIDKSIVDSYTKLEYFITKINDSDVSKLSNKNKFRALKHIFKEFLNVDLEIDKELLEFEPALDTTNE